MNRPALLVALVTLSTAFAAAPPPRPGPAQPPPGAPSAPPVNPYAQPQGAPTPPPTNPYAQPQPGTMPPPQPMPPQQMPPAKPHTGKIKATLQCSMGQGANSVMLPAKDKPKLDQQIVCSVTSDDERLTQGRGLFKTKWISFAEKKPAQKTGEERSAEPSSMGTNFAYFFNLDPGRDFEACSGPLELTFHVQDLKDKKVFETKANFLQQCAGKAP